MASEFLLRCSSVEYSAGQHRSFMRGLVDAKPRRPSNASTNAHRTRKNGNNDIDSRLALKEAGSAQEEKSMEQSGLRLVSVALAVTIAASGAAAQESPGPTAPKSNQGSGESKAAKHSTVLPEKSLTGGGGQSSTGEAAQIEQSAAPLKLSAAQQQKIKSYFAEKRTKELNSVGFSLSIGAAVPRQIELHRLPAAIISALGGFRGDDYVLVGHQLVVVDDNARRVVAIVPNVG
ncbi:MAG: DUF1236 domain-containing protein [Xanthobacteraceae bacterium]